VPDKVREVRAVRDAIVVGREPEKELWSRASDTRVDKLPRKEGTVPMKLLWLSSSTLH